MFGEMVQRTEQLFLSVVEVTDNRFTNLPSFLTALASIVKEMEEVCMCWHGSTSGCVGGLRVGVYTGLCECGSLCVPEGVLSARIFLDWSQN